MPRATSPKLTSTRLVHCGEYQKEWSTCNCPSTKWAKSSSWRIWRASHEKMPSSVITSLGLTDTPNCRSDVVRGDKIQSSNTASQAPSNNYKILAEKEDWIQTGKTINLKRNSNHTPSVSNTESHRWIPANTWSEIVYLPAKEEITEEKNQVPNDSSSSDRCCGWWYKILYKNHGDAPAQNRREFWHYKYGLPHRR